MIYIIALFGLIVGSFLNVCIYRIPRNETIVTTPSHCAKCGAKIKPYDLIPVINFIVLGGKCRSCKNKISAQYPMVELANALLWSGVYLSYGMSINTIFYAIFCSALLVIAIIDYKTLIIPNGILIFILIFGILYNIIDLSKSKIISSVAGFLVISVPLLLISMVTKGGIGGGDIKLMAVCGFYLGIKLTAAGFFIGIFTAAVLSAVLLATKVKKKGDIIPFGPFLSLGLIASLFVGDTMISWYLSFFR